MVNRILKTILLLLGIFAVIGIFHPLIEVGMKKTASWIGDAGRVIRQELRRAIAENNQN